MSDNKQLENLTKMIERLVDNSVASLPPVSPVSSVIPIHTGDHDLLTKLDAKVDQIQLDVTTLKQQGNYFVTQDMHQEVVKLQSDHEARIRILETATTKLMTYGAAVGILLGIAQFLIAKFVN